MNVSLAPFHIAADSTLPNQDITYPAYYCGSILKIYNLHANASVPEMLLWHPFFININLGSSITSHPNIDSSYNDTVRIVTTVSRDACSSYYLLTPEPVDINLVMFHYLYQLTPACPYPLFPAPPYVAPALPVLAAISLPYYPHVPVPGSTFMRLFLLFKMSCVVPILFGVC
uniref:Uncharacterized protein n=2 Tax=Cacopsylla melanoneura TaxID=428564 RepID=A0A8D9DSZ4_9HEMI